MIDCQIVSPIMLDNLMKKDMITRYNQGYDLVDPPPVRSFCSGESGSEKKPSVRHLAAVRLFYVSNLT